MDNFNEAEIQSNETERVQREENRINNETERINSEAERVANEIQRVAREDIRQGFYDSFNSQLAQKVSLSQFNSEISNKANNSEVRKKNENIMLADLDTEVRTAMTGGSVPVVDVDSVGTENIKTESVTSDKRTVLGSFVPLVGTIRWDFDDQLVTFTNCYLVYNNQLVTITDTTVPLNVQYMGNRGYLTFNIKSGTITTIPAVEILINRITENEIIIASFHLLNREVDMFANCYIDNVYMGKVSKSKGALDVLDVTLMPNNFSLVTNQTSIDIKLPSDAKLYLMYNNNNYEFVEIPEIYHDYTLSHNGLLCYDIFNKTFSIKTIGTTILKNRELILLGCQNGLGFGYLEKYVQSKNTVFDTSDNKGWVFNYRFDFENLNTYASDLCFVNDELWCFSVGDDANEEFSEIRKFKVDMTNKTLIPSSRLYHNWGHVNSVEYNKYTDCIICGNGSSVSLPNKIFILQDVSTYNNYDRVDLNEKGIIIDVDSMNWGYKCNVIWGDHNKGRYNIAYVITNDNKNIRKIVLGQGAHQLEYGQFIEGKTGLQYNGTFKVIQEWTRVTGHDVNQGSHYENGKLYIGLGHDVCRYNELTLNEDGTVDEYMFTDKMYDDNGNLIQFVTEGITIKNDYIFISGYKSIFVYKK